MTIYDRGERLRGKIEVDLQGSQGNAFVLMGIAKQVYRSLGDSALILCEGKTIDEIINEMTSGDYDHLVDTLDHYFGKWIDIYR